MSVCLCELSDGVGCLSSYELVVVELPQGGLEWSCCKVTAEWKLLGSELVLAPSRIS